MLLIDITLLALGVVLLLGGAEGLVRGAVALAKMLGVSSLLIGLTLVAFGTSAPELAVGVASVASGQSDFNVGNVVGSNIANVGLILGATALIYPVAVTSAVIRREIPQMIFITTLAMLLMMDYRLDQWEGALLLLGLAMFLWQSIRAGQIDVESAAAEQELEEEMGAKRLLRVGGAWGALAFVLVGLAMLVGGAQLIIVSGTAIASALGIPEVIIGLSLVALGTSLPELATCGVAAMRKQSDIVMGNILGSNIFNLLCVMGTTSAIAPIIIPSRTGRWDLWVMLAFSLVVVPVAATKGRVSRPEGLVLLAAYLGYTILLYVH